ncbi:MAG: hypothetical protein ABIP39_12175 [Polyangiaceae bacterium]
MRSDLVRGVALLALVGLGACATAVNPTDTDPAAVSPDSAAPSYAGSDDLADAGPGTFADGALLEASSDAGTVGDTGAADVILDVTPLFSGDGGCGETACTPVLTRDIGSHFSGAGCTGVESYYTPYNGYDGIRRSWDGNGLAGTTLRTATNISFKLTDGTCEDLWPSGNTLGDFVTIYR